MTFSAQRGAIPLTLDRPRTLFFDIAGTFLLVERYGIRFATALYTVDAASAAGTQIRLKSAEALQYFLWAALQAEATEVGETLTLDQVGAFLRPWLISEIFHALMQALTGALYVPPVSVGNEAAAATPASPAAQKKPSRKTLPKKTSISKTRSGLRLQR